MTSIKHTIKEHYRSFVHGQGLKGRVFRGGMWLGGASFFEQAIRFGRNMLLTRLLAPEAFGAMAIVQSATTLVQMTVDVGAREALIQNPKGADDTHVTAAWWMTACRSSGIYIAVYLLAPFISRFYGNPELVTLTRVVSLAILFDGFISPRAFIAMKQMKFWKWALVNNGGGMLGVITTIILGFVVRDVWALAIGFCSENAARCILSYIICPYRPKLPHFDTIRELLRFSKGLVGLALFNMVFMRADVFVLGKLYAPAALGLYSMAVYLIQTPSVFITNVMNQTLLPALSRVQDDSARVNRIVLQVTSATWWLGLPAVMLVVVCGRSLLTVAYGPRYAAAATALGLACVTVIFNLLNNQITQVFYAKGKPQLHRRAVAAMAVVVVVLVYPLARLFGLWGGQLACLIAILIGYGLQIERIHSVTGLRISTYFKDFPVPVCLAGLVGVPWLLLSRQSGALSRPIPNIALGIAASSLIYAISAFVWFRWRSQSTPSETTAFGPMIQSGMMQETSVPNGD
jgi:O-antigen/teichoic acid export membrane protein